MRTRRRRGACRRVWGRWRGPAHGRERAGQRVGSHGQTTRSWGSRRWGARRCVRRAWGRERRRRRRGARRRVWGRRRGPAHGRARAGRRVGSHGQTARSWGSRRWGRGGAFAWPGLGARRCGCFSSHGAAMATRAAGHSDSPLVTAKPSQACWKRSPCSFLVSQANKALYLAC